MELSPLIIEQHIKTIEDEVYVFHHTKEDPKEGQVIAIVEQEPPAAQPLSSPPITITTTPLVEQPRVEKTLERTNNGK
jgi:hypothetical protein